MGYRSSPSSCILKWANMLAMIVSLSILGIGIWLITKHRPCEKYLMQPLIIIGASIFLISLVGYVGASQHISFLLWIYLGIYFIVLVGLTLFTILGFVITHDGASYEVKSSTNILFKEYHITNYSLWLQDALDKTKNWKHIKDCLLDDQYCNSLTKFMSEYELANGENPVQSGCCRPPIECGYPMVNVTYYDLSQSVGSSAECPLYQNEPDIKCFSCSSCKGGVAQSIKKTWQIVAGANIVLFLFLLVLYIVGCCARSNAPRARYIKMQKKGLEEIRPKPSWCCSCSLETCWQSCLNCCCFSCSQEVHEVEDISSPKHCFGRTKTPIIFSDDELIVIEQERTCWGSFCSLCCPTRRKRKRELACCEPEQINLEDLDPTLVFEKNKAMEDHDQVPYRREDDLTSLDYLEAGWPVQVHRQQGYKCLFCLGQTKKLDPKKKGKVNSSYCTSACCGDRKKGLELVDFQKIDNSLALLGASSGTLVWDKPPLIAQQDLSTQFMNQGTTCSPMKKSSQVHNNILFNQESSTMATLKPKDSLDGQQGTLAHDNEGSSKAIFKPKSPTNEQPKDTPTSSLAGHKESQKANNLPRGWAWLMENSNLVNAPKNMDKKSDVQTRIIQIPEIIDPKFQMKGKDDLDIFLRKEKGSPSLTPSGSRYKERDDNIDTSLVQFAKPEIVDRRIQIKSTDEFFQKREEKFQIIEDDVERLGMIHNKLGILQQQLLQKEQILVLEDRLKEQSHLQRRKEELALEKEQIELLKQQIQEKGHLERKNDELKSKKEHLALLQEVMNEKGQLEMKKTELLMERRQLEELREKICQKQKEKLHLEKVEIEKLQIQVSLEEKGKLKVKEQEIALEKGKLEILRERLNSQEKEKLEIKKEELYFQLEKTKEELVMEKEHLKALQRRLDYQEKGQVGRSKVELAFEKEQLNELKEMFNQKTKEKPCNKKEEFDKEMLGQNLSPKEMIMVERKKDLPIDTKSKNKFGLPSKSTLHKEKYDYQGNKCDHTFIEFEKDTKDFSRLNSNPKPKDHVKNYFPIVSTKKALLLESYEKQSEKEKCTKIDKDLEATRQLDFCRRIDVANCVRSYYNTQYCGSASKNDATIISNNQDKAEELFEIENKKPTRELELPSMEKKGTYGKFEKKHKREPHIQEKVDKQKTISHDIQMTMAKDAHHILCHKDHKVEQSTREVQDEKKRPRYVFEQNYYDNYYKFLDLEGQMYNVQKSKTGKFLKEDDSKKMKQSEMMKSDKMILNHEDKSIRGLTQERAENSCPMKQLLSYNFEPPKKRSDLEPGKKKAKKSDKVSYVPSRIPSPCAGTRFEFPQRLVFTSCNIKNDEGESSYQHERVEHENTKSITNDESRTTTNTTHPTFATPRLTARFKFRGSLDRRAQKQILKKLKEVELEDLKNTLEKKKQMLEKLEREGKSKTITTRNKKYS